MAKKKTANPPVRPATELKRLDRELIELMDQRRAAAEALAAKKPSETTSERLAADDARIEKLLAGYQGPIPAGRLAAVLREAIALEHDAQRRLRVAYLGPENTFSHQAAAHRFGAGADLTPVGTIAAVFEEVETGACDFGVVPLENSTDGRVTDTLGCFGNTSVKICGELPLRIHHCLLGSGPRGGIKSVCSKPQALSQCRGWLASRLPNADVRPVSSTAEAAAMAKRDPAIAAIASERAGDQLGLAILDRNIEDQKDNITRFAVIGSEPADKTGADKTALMFEMPHEPGALADAMAIFKRRKLNLTWIESFPIPGSGGRYLFFVEFLGHQAELMPRRAIADLAKKAAHLVVLGSYPTTPPIG